MDLSQISATERVGNRGWRERDSEISEWLEEKILSVIVATDGSIRDDVTAWGGGVAGGVLSGQQHNGRCSSSYRAEC